MTSPLPTEALEAIVAGCEGVTPGPWSRLEDTTPDETIVWTDANQAPVCAIFWYRGSGGNSHRDAAHIARLSPEVVRAMATMAKEAARLRVAMNQVRAAFTVAYGPDGRILTVSHDGDALRPMIAILDAALTEGATHGR